MQGSIAAACIMLAGLIERIKLVPRLATVGLWLLVVYAPIMHAISAGPGSLLGDLGVVDSAGVSATSFPSDISTSSDISPHSSHTLSFVRSAICNM